MKHMKRILSMILCLVTVLSMSVGCIVTVNAEETTDIRETWWADPDWRAEFNAWCDNYYNDGKSDRKTVYEIGSVPELYAFWRVTLHRKSQYTGSNAGQFNTTDWTSSHFTNLTTYDENANDSLYATRFTFKLTANIDLQGAEWPGILNFCGYFDGNGYTISNFTQTVSPTLEELTATNQVGYTQNAGFFRNVSITGISTPGAPTNGYIKNLALDNYSIVIDENATGFSVDTNAKAYSAGGLIGNYKGSSGQTSNITEGSECIFTVSNVMMTNATVKIKAVTGYSSSPATYRRPRVGGVVGAHTTANNKLVLENVLFQGNVSSEITPYTLVAGFVADTNNSSGDSNPLVMTNCLNLANISMKEGNSRMRVWCARTNVDENKATPATCLSFATVTATGALSKNSDFTVRDLTANPFTTADIPAGGAWYADELFGIIPAGLADNVLYKMFVQKTTTPDANGKYKIRILGVLSSLDLEKVELDVKVIAADEATANASADSAWTTVNIPTVKKVYTSVMAAGKTVTAEDLGGEYLYGAVLTGIPAGETVTIRVCATKTLADGTVQQMMTRQITVTVPSGT